MRHRRAERKQQLHNYVLEKNNAADGNPHQTNGVDYYDCELHLPSKYNLSHCLVTVDLEKRLHTKLSEWAYNEMHREEVESHARH